MTPLEGIKVTLIDALLIHHRTTKPCVACLGDVDGIAAVLAPVVAGAVERAVEEAAVRVECEATNAGTARDFMLAEAARLVREGGQPS